MSIRDHTTPTTPASRISRALTTLTLRLPNSEEHGAADPKSRSQRLAAIASRKAAAISTGLSLPPGPFGLVTILPDLLVIWKLPSQLVSDIAGTYGKTASLTPESMIYCLFRHGGAALLRDIVVRMGERFVMRRATLRVMEDLLSKIGVRITQRTLGRALARYVPLLGAGAIGAYAYYDTSKVASNAIELFAAEIVVQPKSARSASGSP